MSDTFICDYCDSRIKDGHTVAWCDELTDSAMGIGFSRRGKTHKHICKECWPDRESGLLHRVKTVLGLGGGQ